MFGITFHDQLYGSWDQAKGYLVEELQQLHAVLDRRVGSFLANTSRGAIVVGNVTGNEWTALPIGAADTVLRSNGLDPSWQKVVLSTDVTGTLGVTHGGTGLATVAQGDLLYGSATNVLSALAKDTNATRYLSNTGTTNNPAWAQINLANGVTGDLPYANLTPSANASRLLGRESGSAGDWEEITLGTGLSMSGTTLSSTGGTGVGGYTHTQGGAATTWTIAHGLGTKVLAVDAVDGSGVVIIPDSITYTDDNTITLTFTTALSGKAYVVGGSTSTTGANALLDGTNHTDTLAGTVVRGDLIVGNSTPKWARLAKGSSGAFLRGDGTDTAWSTLILPNSATANRIVYATASNTWGDSADLTYDGTDLGLGSGKRFRMQSQNRIRYLNSTANVKKSSDQTGLTSGSYHTITFNDENFDTDSIHDTVTDNSRLTCQLTGKYLITTSIFAADDTLTTPNSLDVAIVLNGGTFIAVGRGAMDSGNNSTASVSVIYSLVATDYVEVQTNVDAFSGNYKVQAQPYNTFSMAYIGE